MRIIVWRRPSRTYRTPAPPPGINKEEAVKIARKYWIVLGLAAAVLLGSSSKASAQYYGRPRYYAPAPAYYPPSAYRSGLVIGGGIGFGGLTADQCGDLCGGGLSLEGHIGGMLNPQVGADVRRLDGDSPDHQHRRRHHQHALHRRAAVLGVADRLAQGRHRPRQHARSAATASGRSPTRPASRSWAAPASSWCRAGPFALDLQGRVGHTFFADADGGPITQYAFMIGFNWY